MAYIISYFYIYTLPILKDIVVIYYLSIWHLHWSDMKLKEKIIKADELTECVYNPVHAYYAWK